MECGEQCVVIMTGITMMPELCADNWGSVWTQAKVSLFIDCEKMLQVTYTATDRTCDCCCYYSRVVVVQADIYSTQQ